jgi:predicted membrane-bound spermidine synthase
MASRTPAKKSEPSDAAWFLLLLAFFEGAAVMACELIGARLAAPYFGSSLTVWAAVLGVTLTALMCGYYTGGWLSEKFRSRAAVFFILAAAGALLIAMPVLSQWVMNATINMAVRSGATLSLCIYMFPPLFFMGMSSPVVIHLLNERAETSGKTAGSVYAISTLGGILATFLLGFWLMPWLGLRVPAFAFGAALVTLSVAGFLMHRRGTAAVGAGAVLVLGAMSLGGQKNTVAGDVSILEIQEGILGQIKVADLTNTDDEGAATHIRLLLVNNIAQTIMNRDNPDQSMSEYIFGYAAALSVFPRGSKALALGLGGGALIRHFDRFGFDTDIVELDPRIRDVAARHFGIGENRPILIDDARHFLNTTDKKYDVIALDLFASESPPSDVLSLEGLRLARKCLNPGGVLAINFTGRLHEPQGRVSRSLIRTLREAGFHVKALRMPQADNLLLLAGESDRDYSMVDYSEAGSQRRMQNLERHFMNLDLVDFSDAAILDDNHALFEALYADVALDWRRVTREQIQENFTSHGLQMVR